MAHAIEEGFIENYYNTHHRIYMFIRFFFHGPLRHEQLFTIVKQLGSVFNTDFVLLISLSYSRFAPALSFRLCMYIVQNIFRCENRFLT